MKWFDHWVEVSRTQKSGENGLIGVKPDRLMSALLSLAYDLYVLRHHSKLQDEMVNRLRHRDQFHGARYELGVAPTFVRAGSAFDYEDETDGNKKHVEFVATFVPSGFGRGQSESTNAKGDR